MSYMRRALLATQCGMSFAMRITPLTHFPRARHWLGSQGEPAYLLVRRYRRVRHPPLARPLSATAYNVAPPPHALISSHVRLDIDPRSTIARRPHAYDDIWTRQRDSLVSVTRQGRFHTLFVTYLRPR